jgi:hypothetical protein
LKQKKPKRLELIKTGFFLTMFGKSNFCQVLWTLAHLAKSQCV